MTEQVSRGKQVINNKKKKDGRGKEDEDGDGERIIDRRVERKERNKQKVASV